MRYTYADRINRVKGIIGGMTSYGDMLEKWGITKEFIAQQNTLYNQACENEQKKNDLKADAQQLTAGQEQLMKELESNCAFVKKLARFQLSKEYWPAFGFRQGEYRAKETPVDTGE